MGQKTVSFRFSRLILVHIFFFLSKWYSIKIKPLRESRKSFRDRIILFL